MQETIKNIEIKSGKCAFIHSATIHQGDELFSVEQSRGKQCAFMSLSAVLTAQQPTNRLDGQQQHLISHLIMCYS